MNLLPWRKSGHAKLAEIDARDKQAKETHKDNIKSIVKAGEGAVTLKRVLKENNITIELAKAMGHS